MATYIITLVALFMAFFQSSTSSANIPPKDRDLRVAIEEMEKANYFTFVTLINMPPLDRKFIGNVTFFMPTDRMLSKTVIPQNAVSSFLRRHSIPSPLLFEHLLYIPTGSILPSSKPVYMLNVSNGSGRRSFFLNNVRIISPNVCTAGSSIRCHGIDGVLTRESNISLHTCSNSAGSVAAASHPVSAPPLPLPSPSTVPFLSPPDDDDFDFPVPALLPAASSQHNSGSSPQFLSDRNLVKLILTTLLVLSLIGVPI